MRKSKYSEKIPLKITLLTENPIWSTLGVNPSHSGETASSRLNYVTVPIYVVPKQDGL
jgi:hypothetical protein